MSHDLVSLIAICPALNSMNADSGRTVVGAKLTSPARFYELARTHIAAVARTLPRSERDAWQISLPEAAPHLLRGLGICPPAPEPRNFVKRKLINGEDTLCLKRDFALEVEQVVVGLVTPERYRKDYLPNLPKGFSANEGAINRAILVIAAIEVKAETGKLKYVDPKAFAKKYKPHERASITQDMINGYAGKIVLLADG